MKTKRRGIRENSERRKALGENRDPRKRLKKSGQREVIERKENREYT